MLKKKTSRTGTESTVDTQERRRPGAYSISGSDVEDDFEGSGTDIDANADSLQPEDESTSENTGIVISNAHLVSEPPDEFNNCQVCMVACDGGGGWAACKDMCVPDATFSCQSDTMGKFKQFKSTRISWRCSEKLALTPLGRRTPPAGTGSLTQPPSSAPTIVLTQSVSMAWDHRRQHSALLFQITVVW